MQSLAQVDFVSQEIKTMSSRVIADICQTSHDVVLKTIRSLVERGIVSGNETQYIHEQNKQSYPEFLLNFRDSMIVASGYSVELRARIIDRWQYLELAKKANNSFTIPTTFAEALRLAADQSEALLIANEKLATAAPKVEYYEKIVVRDHLLNATQVAQKVGMSAVKMNVILTDLSVYSKAVKRSRTFQQWFIDKGYGELKQTDAGYPQAMFTLAGEAWIIQKFISEGLV